MPKNNIPCLLVGESGSGKSSSFRNLDPTKTVILNTERKILPFKKFNKFKNINISTYKDFAKVMKELKKNDTYDYVIIDSLTSLLEICNKYTETVYSGYSIWKEYNSLIYDILQDMKDLPQQVFVTGIPVYAEPEPGEYKAYVKTKGKEWLYSIEKEFAIVLHTHLADDEEGNITDYQFDTRPSKHTSAKTPSEMFSDRYIENDVTLVVEAIDAYYDD